MNGLVLLSHINFEFVEELKIILWSKGNHVFAVTNSWFEVLRNPIFFPYIISWTIWLNKHPKMVHHESQHFLRAWSESRRTNPSVNLEPIYGWPHVLVCHSLLAFIFSTQNENGFSARLATFAVANAVTTPLPTNPFSKGGDILDLMSTAKRTVENSSVVNRLCSRPPYVS